MKSFKEEMRQHLEVRGKGFTLIEVIVVLVIIAILIAIAVPNVLGYINRAKETEAQAKARNMYLGCTAELALMMGDIKGIPGYNLGDYNVVDQTIVSFYSNDEHLKHIYELTGETVDESYFMALPQGTSGYAATGDFADSDIGEFRIYISRGVVAYVVYYADNGSFATYNGVTGNVSLGEDAVLYDYDYN